MSTLKDEVKLFWNRYPCAKNLIGHPEGTAEFFQMHDDLIDRLTPYHNEVYRYQAAQGKRVLEVGCGMGTHAWRFAQYAGEFYAVDLSQASVNLARKRFALRQLPYERLLVSDAENLPFPNNYFDYVISNGVIHHSPNTEKAVEEIYRVLKSEGTAIVMLYHKNSIFYRLDLMCIGRIKYALLKIMPQRLLGPLLRKRPNLIALKSELARTSWSGLAQIVLRFSDGHFNPHTKVYTLDEAKRLFGRFREVRIELRNSSDRLLEKIGPLGRAFGWGLYVYAKK